MTDNLSLQEWNNLLVEVLFQERFQGTTRLFLSFEHISRLAEQAKLMDEEVICSLYAAVSACDISGDFRKHVIGYLSTLRGLPKHISKDHQGDYQDDDEFQEILIDHQVKETPPFLAHLVIIVHAYMSGEREGIDPNDVYRTVATEIAEVLCETDDLERIHKDLVHSWQLATCKQLYVIGTGDAKRRLGHHSPWGILKRWTELRAETLAGGAIALDTIDTVPGPHGTVRPIRYHAPFLSDDRKVLERIGRDLRRESEVKPSDYYILQYIRRHTSELSARARRTLNDAFENSDEGAACFVDLVNAGFMTGPDPEPETVAKIPMEDGGEIDSGSQDFVRLEIKIRPDYYGELELSVRIVDIHESDDDFIIEHFENPPNDTA